MKHLVIGYKGSIGSRHYRLLQEAGEEVCGWDVDETPEYKSDMTWICTPNSSHYLYAKDIDGKIFIEKPVTDNLKQAEILRGKQIWVACNYRFHPAIQILKESLPKVGKVLYARLHFSHYLPYQRENWQEYIKDTNIVMDAGWHFVDLAIYLFGKTVNNKTKNLYRLEFKDTDKLIDTEFNDMAKIVLYHEKDIYSFIDIDYLRRDKSCGIEVVGTEGTITYDLTKVKPDEMYCNQIKYLLTENWQSNLDEAIEVMKICG